MSDRRLTWDWMRGFGGFLGGKKRLNSISVNERQTHALPGWNGRMSGSSVVDVVVNYNWEEAQEAHAARAMQGGEREAENTAKRWDGNLGLE